jgi:hypothetical protein
MNTRQAVVLTLILQDPVVPPTTGIQIDLESQPFDQLLNLWRLFYHKTLPPPRRWKDLCWHSKPRVQAILCNRINKLKADIPRERNGGRIDRRISPAELKIGLELFPDS